MAQGVQYHRGVARHALGMPSVIIETHHAWDFQEPARWKEPRTLEAFSAAVVQGLVDALSNK